MRGMTKKEQIIELHQQGVSRTIIPEIAKCSRNYVSAILQNSRQEKFRPYTSSQCIFDGVRNWLNENSIYPYKLAEMLVGASDDASVHIVSRRLSGKTRMDIDTAMDITQISGKSFEELFMAGGNA